MNESKEINELKEKFHLLMEKGVAYFYEDIESIKRECLNYMVSKTYCINIRPFEAERFGFKLGRALKKSQLNIKRCMNILWMSLIGSGLLRFIMMN